MGQPVVHWEIGGRDLKRLQGFYSSLFDWKIGLDEAASYALVETGSEEGIGGGIMRAKAGPPNYVTFYVSVDDIQAYLDRAESLGGKTLMPPMPIPNVGAWAFFADPEGNGIGLFEHQ